MNLQIGYAFGETSQAVDASVLIIGAGFSGIAMAIALQNAGIDFLILEKATDFGGTWRDNIYPGAACDIPSHLYSYSFEPYRWSRSVATQPEILAYQKKVARKHRLYENIRFNSEVISSIFDENHVLWQVTLASGETLRARILISARGLMHTPYYPKIKNLNTFKGTVIHSARWDNSVDLSDKRIAVVGTGVSAIQIVPEIAKYARRLMVFQRTPAWVMPKIDFAYSEKTKDAFEQKPLTRIKHRAGMYWQHELWGTGFISNSKFMKIGEIIAKRHLQQVQNPLTRSKLTPNYAIGCKQVLHSNNYYPTFNQSHVKLVNCDVKEMDEQGIVVEGMHYGIDILILCTGFEVNKIHTNFAITGKANVSLNEHWKNGVHAYKGITTHGFPNLYFLLGPNTALGHNSTLFMIEAQVKYIVQALTYMQNKSYIALEVKQNSEDEYNKKLQHKLQHTVWNTDCKSWYKDKNGRNTAIWPSYAFNYWLKTRFFDPDEYDGRVGSGTSISKHPIKRIVARKTGK